MARYYFDIDDGQTSFVDDNGVEVASRKLVRDEAIMVLPDLAREELPDGDHRVFSVQVRDELHHVIFRATLTLHAEWLPT